MAIRFPCGAKHRPAPEGPERERIATALTGFTMTVIFVAFRTILAAVRYRPPSVIARRAKPDVAIRFPLRCFAPPGPEGAGKRTDCHSPDGLRNDGGFRYAPYQISR